MQSAGTGIALKADNGDVLLAYGTTVPADGGLGYATGCLFLQTDGGAGTALYVNEGSRTSCDFDAATVA